jgi:hypothetical protein
MTGSKLIPLAEAERRAGGAPRNPASRLDVTRAPDLDGVSLPQRRWLVKDWIPDRAVTLLGGDGGTGKSLLALQLMASAALGRPWLGIETQPRRSLGLFCEDDADEVHLRLAGIARHMGVSLGELDGVAWSARSGKPNVLMHFAGDSPGKRTDLCHELVARARDEGARLVVIDTLADAFGGNENYRGQARAFINMLRDLANYIDGAVILTAHPSVAGQNSGTGLSGSTAWNNSVRSRLYLTRLTHADADPDMRVLKRMKANYSGAGDQIRLVWRNGVLQPVDAPGGMVGTIERRNVEAIFLECLAVLAGRGMRVNTSKFQQTYGPKVIAVMKEARGCSIEDLERAMTRLLAEGRIKVEEDGPKSRRRTFLVVADGGIE